VAGKPAPAGSYPTDKARLEAALAKFVVAAEAYPKTDAGLLARNQAAGILVLLDRPAEGIKRYQEVMDLAGQGSIYYEMARLGKVSAQAQAKQFDEAISTFQSLSANKDGEVPADAMLMQLGRVYLLAGKTTEARQTFRKLLDEYPQSPFVTEAKRQFDQLSEG
jgi:tetratricopeptide (TPR) repeat protein